ncbi:MAG: glycosyl hydrolase, partial [Rhodothermales bacterium]|nr:glycosyl hydrolase [Rhodothermales bacterium]
MLLFLHRIPFQTMRFPYRSLGWLGVMALGAWLAAAPAHAQQLDTTKLAALQARAIGPAGMSGRVTTVDVVRHDPDVIYAGTASGGLWKSESGGIGWVPIFDDQPVASIGAVAIDPTNPDVIWVGTGEGNPRNSQTNGNGVYKSLDGGATWAHLGLEDSRNIHRILVNPQNPDVVYVGAQGPAWGETDERGVFKTTDGGATWEKILYLNERTGIADLVMDPQNPNKLIAAMWEFRRWPWFFKSGGEGSGLYVTFDGGQTWTERTSDDGLPAGELGRMGLAIAPSRPNVVYAFVEAEKDNALYRSTDGGRTWAKTRGPGPVGNRPFYYADIYVDPVNENRVYSIHSTVTLSEDGGDTFKPFVGWEVHPDHHAWYIHPDDPDFIIDGNDGGLAISRDRGETWRFVENLPLAQFYHVSVDMEVPYNVYGGLQDNGSWKGPSQVWRAGGIRNAYWQEVAFGDGFDVVSVPGDPRYLYAMSQGGNLRRVDVMTGEQKNIKPIHPDGEFLRFNWNAAIAQDPFDPNTIYYGSQHVHKSTDRGDTWTLISPDLTTDDPEKQKQIDSGGLTYDVTQAENFTTIVAIAPSPLERGVIWVGTDDGNVQLTRDGGQTWTNTVGAIRGVPEGTWVPQIRPSKHNPAEAFVVFDNHRRNDWTPYVYRTADYGRSWTRLAGEGDVWGYALAIDQDPVAPDLLVLGTEFGLYVSIDGGEAWTKWTHGFPTVSTM